MRQWLLSAIGGVDRRLYEDALDIIEEQSAEIRRLEANIELRVTLARQAIARDKARQGLEEVS